MAWVERVHTPSAPVVERATEILVNVSASLDTREEDAEERHARTIAPDTDVACTIIRSTLP